MTGLLTRPIVAFVSSTSSAVELRPYCAAMHSYPSACRGPINLLKQEPSDQSPWQNTMLGLACVDILGNLLAFLDNYLGLQIEHSAWTRAILRSAFGTMVRHQIAPTQTRVGTWRKILIAYW